MDRDRSDDQDDVIMWLGLAAGLHEDVWLSQVEKVKPKQVSNAR